MDYNLGRMLNHSHDVDNGAVFLKKAGDTATGNILLINSTVQSDNLIASINAGDTQISQAITLPVQTGHAGQYLQTDGSVASWAAVQTSYALAVQTTSATPTMMIYNGQPGVPMIEQSWYICTASIVAVDTADPYNQAFGMKLDFTFEKHNYAETFVHGLVRTTLWNTSGYDATAVTTAYSSFIQFLVTGLAGRTINWSSKLDVVRVADI